jgi:hypothetical protein
MLPVGLIVRFALLYTSGNKMFLLGTWPTGCPRVFVKGTGRTGGLTFADACLKVSLLGGQPLHLCVRRVGLDVLGYPRLEPLELPVNAPPAGQAKRYYKRRGLQMFLLELQGILSL